MAKKKFLFGAVFLITITSFVSSDAIADNTTKVGRIRMNRTVHIQSGESAIIAGIVHHECDGSVPEYWRAMRSATGRGLDEFPDGGTLYDAGEGYFKNTPACGANTPARAIGFMADPDFVGTVTLKFFGQYYKIMVEKPSASKQEKENLISKARSMQGRSLSGMEIQELLVGNTLIWRRSRVFYKDKSIMSVNHKKRGEFDRGWSVKDDGIYCGETFKGGKSCRSNVNVGVSDERINLRMTIMNGRLIGREVIAQLSAGNGL